MLDPVVVAKLKERYDRLNPLLVHRSVERARSLGDLFDILESVPEEGPLVWDSKLHAWVTSDDILQVENFQFSG